MSRKDSSSPEPRLLFWLPTTKLSKSPVSSPTSTGVSVVGLVCDITDRDAVASTVGRLERIDVLINNAGLELITPIDTAGSEVEETFRRIIDINVMGTYYVTREALGRMHEGGRIILTSSMWG